MKITAIFLIEYRNFLRRWSQRMCYHMIGKLCFPIVRCAQMRRPRVFSVLQGIPNNRIIDGRDAENLS